MEMLPLLEHVVLGGLKGGAGGDPAMEKNHAVAIGLNGAGLVCGVALALAILVGICYSRHLMDRVSVRLTLGLALADAAKALVLLLCTTGPQGAWCVAHAAALQWVSLAYVLLNVAIALNLHLVFVQGIPFESYWEMTYWATTLGLPTVLTAAPLLAGKLGLDTDTCEYVFSYAPDSFLWPWLTHLLWVVAGCAYCGLVAVLALAKLHSKDNILSKVKRRELAFAHDLEAHVRFNAKLDARNLVCRM